MAIDTHDRNGVLSRSLLAKFKSPSVIGLLLNNSLGVSDVLGYWISSALGKHSDINVHLVAALGFLFICFLYLFLCLFAE